MTFVHGLLQTGQPTCWRWLTPDLQLSFSSHHDFSQEFQFKHAWIYGSCGHFKICFLFLLFSLGGVAIRLRSHLLRGKKEASRKDIVECLRGSQLLSMLLDISGSYNMKSSIWLWSHMSRRGMPLAKLPQNVMPFTFKTSTCEEQTSVMGHNLLYLDKLSALPH